MSVNEINSIINKAQIYEDQTFNQFLKENENFIPKYLWEQYQNQFKWMFYKNGILQCSICQEAYRRFSSKIEYDEWTEVNEYSYRVFNKENLILILKIHDFSENHTCSVNLLNTELDSVQNIGAIESDKSGDLCFNETNNNISESFSDEMLTLPVISSSKSSSRWSHYIDYYPWLYLKHNNPGCRYCEDAFKISTEMSATKWTDPTPTFELNCGDRPKRALRQHQISKNHQRALKILNGNPLDDETDQISNGNFPMIFKKERWKYLKRKFSWLYFTSGNYHCMYCEHSYKSPSILNTLESESDNYSEITWLRHFTKHQSSSAHKVAKEKFHSNGSLTLEILDDECDNSVSVEENNLSSVYHEINYELWRKLTDKYSWFIGENGKYYGCKVCQNASKICSSFSNPNLWTHGMIPFTIITTYEHLRKKLYRHNLNKTHLLGMNLENPLDNVNEPTVENIKNVSTNDSLTVPDPIAFNKFLTEKVINSFHDSTYDLI